MRYRLIDDTSVTVRVTVNGQTVELPAGRSLLAGLAVAGLMPDMFCAIGQCQRCAVRVNGREEIACLSFPHAGDEIEMATGPGT